MATNDETRIKPASSVGSDHMRSMNEINHDEILPRFDRAAIEAIYNQSTDLNILIAGVTGSGKSSLANAIAGSQNAFTEGSNVGHCTEHVTPEPSRRMKKLRIWDSPGLMDGTNQDANYLREIDCILKHFEAGDMIIFCIEAKPRFILSRQNQDVQALLKMKKKFGVRLFSFMVIALTYSDTIKVRACGRDEVQYYQERLQEYKDKIQEAIEKQVGIDHNTAQNIPVLPVQHQTKGNTLPDEANWLTDLWKGCLHAVPDIQGKAKWIGYFKERIVEEEDPDPEVARTQVVLSDNFFPQRLLEWKSRYQRRGGSLGVLGLLGGPLGLLTIPLGIWSGGKYGERRYRDSLIRQ